MKSRKSASKLLATAELGLQVDLAPDGAEAVRRTAETAYDLILMDVQMPIMDGLTATRTIRARPGPRARRSPTANTFDEDRKACFDAGMNDFIPKPADPDQLFITLLRQVEALPPPPIRPRRPTAA